MTDSDHPYQQQRVSSMTTEPIELLAPARDLQCGLAAIDHGADAVYIGGDRFGARAGATNSMADIAKLCAYAHLYNSKVYLTLNTILFEDELTAARQLAIDAWNEGVDGLIIQDMALLEMDLPPIPLHASTQMNNVTPEHVRFLEAAGISRVVLARELDLASIMKVRKATTVPLEIFIHGALCVSYSGRCWMSAAMGGRSANRGSCGQPCRLAWNLTDENGTQLATESHLLSLKDMDRSAHLKPLLEAGITAFKIEGRLKDIAYVKNLTALYRRALDTVLEEKPELNKSSDGIITHHFIPDPAKTFHRGATDYFFLNERAEIWNFATPKSIGKRMGTIRKVENDWFTLNERTDLGNGDGICWIDERQSLRGMQINRVTETRIYPAVNGTLKTSLKPGTVIYRNHDHRFRKKLEGKTAERKIPVTIRFSDNRSTLLLEMEDQAGNRAAVEEPLNAIRADRPESVNGIVQRQLAKLGNSPFTATRITVRTGPWFFRSSLLNQMRRLAVERLQGLRLENRKRAKRRPPAPGFTDMPYPESRITKQYNVANSLSEQFYRNHGAVTVEKAFELNQGVKDHPLMTTRHCLRYAMGACPRYHGTPDTGDWVLTRKEKRFRIRFDCARCQMHIFREEPTK